MFLEKRSQERLQAIDGLRQTLDNQIFSIAIDNQAGKQIPFSENSTTEFGISSDAGSEVIGLLKSLSEKCRINGPVTPCQETEGDLRLRAVEGFSDYGIAVINNGGDSTWWDIYNVGDIAAIDPQMSIADSRDARFANADLTLFLYGDHSNLHAP
jgi:hypothetical protein